MGAGEDYCKRCGDLFDPLFGCRCSLLDRAEKPRRLPELMRLGGATILVLSGTVACDTVTRFLQ